LCSASNRNVDNDVKDDGNDDGLDHYNIKLHLIT